MIRTAWLVCLLVLAGVASADVAPDYPLTWNFYRFELAQAEGFDATGVELILVTQKLTWSEEEENEILTNTFFAASKGPLRPERRHYRYKLKHTLYLVRGELPDKLDQAWFNSADVLAHVDVDAQLSSYSRAKGDNAAFRKQTYTVRVTPALKDGVLHATAVKTSVERMDKSGKVLEAENLTGKESGSLWPRSSGLLGLCGLLGLLGLGGLSLSRRDGSEAA